jgi:hypothetical protein
MLVSYALGKVTQYISPRRVASTTHPASLTGKGLRVAPTHLRLTFVARFGPMVQRKEQAYQFSYPKSPLRPESFPNLGTLFRVDIYTAIGGDLNEAGTFHNSC